MNGVLVKNFNMWRQSSEESYIDKQTWDLAKIEKPNTHKRRVWLGVDVGRVSDLFAISPMVMMDDYWYLDSFSFVEIFKEMKSQQYQWKGGVIYDW